MSRLKRLSLLVAGALLVSFAAALAFTRAGPQEPRDEVALFGTIPIYWGEAADMQATLRGEAELHWAREVLERSYDLTPVDTLDAEGLAGKRYLLLAQPRALSGSENVALDVWVREGGRVLLFADPLYTGHSEFGIGDRRRPQDVALLSPILARWGLALHFDDTANDALHQRDTPYGSLPIEYAGTLRSAPSEHADAECAFKAEALIADCSVGQGRALIVADATLLAEPDGEEALMAMAGQAFSAD